MEQYQIGSTKNSTRGIELNWYNIYYNTPKEKPTGSEIRKIYKYGQESKGFVLFYKNLLEFLKEKEIETMCFEKPMDKQNMRSKINAMKTIIYQRGLNKEFFDRYYPRKDE